MIQQQELSWRRCECFFLLSVIRNYIRILTVRVRCITLRHVVNHNIIGRYVGQVNAHAYSSDPSCLLPVHGKK